MAICYTHTNINAKDWRKLSKFYQDVFGCTPVGPMRDLHDPWFGNITGIPGAAVQGEHIALPGYPEGGPTLEIFTYNLPEGEHPAYINSYGFAHIAFAVDDVDAIFEAFVKAGGSAYGPKELAYYPKLDKTLTVIYAKDPEGNAVELMHWDPGDCT